MARAEPARRRVNRIVAFTIALFLFAGVGIVLSGAAWACDSWNCNPDPLPEPPQGGQDRFFGQAALFTKDGSVVDSGAGSSCPGCEWRIAPACELGGEVTCSEVARCGRTEGGDLRTLYDVFLRRPGTGWTLRGAFCIADEDDVVTTADVGDEVRRRWQVWVPKQRVSVQPADGRTLVHLPAYFHSGQPARMPPTTVPVFGFEVTVAAQGEWEWTFEPGVTRTFHVPGSRYDDANPVVSHVYETPGTRTVSLTTRWWGRFTVGSFGPYDIDDPATQGPALLEVTAVEAAPVLSR